MPLPPGAKLLSLPPGAKLVTAASAPMTETKAPEQTGMISSFVKGLKTFTPPLGAGSVYNEEETSAALNKARTDPAGYLADQIPFVSQIKKIVSDLKGGKDKGDVAAEAIGELVAGAAGSPPIMKGGATPATARARYGGGLAETPKPSKPVNVGGLMEMAKTGKDILQVLKSPNPLTKLSALGRLFEKFASEVTPIEAPPAPTVVEAPPVASGTPVRPPLRGKQFGTFNDPAAPPLPAGVEPSGPVRPPLQGRQFGTTVAKMMREEVPGKQFGTSSQSRLVPAEAAAAAPAEMPALQQITEWLASRDGQTARRFTDPVVSEAPITKQTLGDIMDRLMKNRKVPAEVPAATVPAEVPPAAVETPQPATPAPSAAGKPVTAATLMEEATKPATQVNNPNYDWRASEGITAEFKQYLKDSGFDVVPDRPEFDPTNPKAQGKFGGSAKTQVNMDAKANRFVEYLKANKMEPTPDNVARATQTLGEADHPSAHTLEKIYTQMGYDALDVEELLARSMPKVESPAASAAPNPLASAPEVPKAAAKPTAKPRSKQTTVGELMEKAKSAEQSNIHASEVSFDTPRSVSGKKEIRVYSQDPEGTGMHVTKDGVQRMLTIVEAPGGVGRYQVIAKPVGGGVSYQPGYSSLAEKPVKAATETIGGSYSLQDAKKVAESYAKGNPHPFEAVERGVPISAYEPKNKPIKFVESRFSSGGFNNQNIEGANVWTDGAAAFSGKAPGPLSTLEKQPNIKGIWEDAAKTSATPAKAVGSFLEDGRHRIVFDNGTQIDGQYYDWVNKKYPSAEFRVGKNVKDVVTVWKDGKQVGVISPLRPGTGYELPNNIKQMMPKVKK